MTDRRAIVWAVVLAVSTLLAGCGGLGGGSASGPTPTVTPVDPPDPEAPLAPGVYESTINATALADAHHGTLANRSFTVTERLRTTANETVRYRWVGVRRAGPGGTPLSITQQFRFRTNGTAAYALYFDGNETFVRQAPITGDARITSYDGRPGVEATGRHRIADLFESLQVYDVERVEDGIRVSGSVGELASVPEPLGITRPRNVTMTALVGPDGLVERLAIGYDAAHHGTPIRVRYTLQISDVDSTTVERPTWVREGDRPTPSDRSARNDRPTPTVDDPDLPSDDADPTPTSGDDSSITATPSPANATGG